MIRKIDHLVITTAKLPACIAFYEALGFQTQDAGGRWELFAGDFKINVHVKNQELEPKAKNVQTGSADFCIEMDCPISQCREMLLKQKITIEMDEVTRHGVRGEMRSLYLRDPDGNLVELCCYEAT